MSEKRRTRYGGEPPPKKRHSTSPPAPTSTKAHAPRSATRQTPKAPPPLLEPVEESLPTRLKDGQKLPVLLKPQDLASFSDSEYQSIPESGVLKASLEQSRLKWLTDNVFEKYWVKPSKKKGSTPKLGTELLNPPSKSMSKLGPCSLIIEPHVFDCTLYLARDSLGSGYQTPGAGQTPPPPAVFDAFAQPAYNAQRMPNNELPRYSAPMGGGQRSPSQFSLPPFREGFGKMSAQQPPQSARPPISSQYSASSSISTPSHTTTAANRPSDPSPYPNSSIPAPPAKPNGDPVIQMLAARAASDRELKSLMKVVAAGTATSEQMKVFQNLIDELNGIIRKQEMEAAVSGAGSGEMTQPEDQTEPAVPEHKTIYEGGTSQRRNSSQSTNGPGTTLSTPMKPEPSTKTSTHQTSSAFNTPSYPYTIPKTTITQKANYTPFHSHPHYQQSPQHPPPPLSQNSSIVMEFQGPSSLPTRYLLPRLSILEILPTGHQAILSFLAIISDHNPNPPSNNSKEKEKPPRKKFYQPITIRLSATQPRILEPLRRAVAPAEEVRKWMEGIFNDNSYSRAEERWLAVRLPREEKLLEEKEKDNKKGGMMTTMTMPGEESAVKENWEWGWGMAPLVV